MKIFWIIISIFINGVSMATTAGSLDTTIGFGRGWIESYRNNEDIHTSAVVVDSQSRFILANSREDANGNFDIEIIRRLANGEYDGSFILVQSNAKTPIDEFVSLAIDDSDGIIYAYTFENCSVPNQSCHKDIAIVHNNKHGDILSSQTLGFDLGGTPLRMNDVLVDIKYIPFQNSLIVVSTSDNTAVQDTDFAVAKYFVDPSTGEMSLFTPFSGDGKQICYFDHFDAAGSYDQAAALTIMYPDETRTIPSSIVVGGSAFEGNGSNNDGWNLAFCEFSLNDGAIMQQWSTLSNLTFFYNTEILKNMDFDFRLNQQSLIVAAEVPGANDLDFSVTKFSKNPGTGSWTQNSDFGVNNTGWNSIGYSELFIGNTTDLIKELLVLEDGSFIVAGDAAWQDGLMQHSKAALAKFNGAGELDTKWGYDGKITHTFRYNLDPTITEKVHSMHFSNDQKSIYLSGAHLNTDGNKGGFTAKLINIDLIFRNGFD